MALVQITLPGYRCERCGHEWIARPGRLAAKKLRMPRICPKCKSGLWNTPRTTRGTK